MAEYVDEFRGTDDLYYAEVLIDDNGTNTAGSGETPNHGYVTGTVKRLAPVAEISKTVETASDTKYYDNKPALTINAEGADTITLNIPALDLATLADITGKQIDATTGAFMDGESTPKYFALGYRLGLTDGTYRYVWRYKGSFGIPDETSTTKNAGTDSAGQTLTYTGIMTTHKFTKAVDAQGNPKSQKALVVDERDGKADLSDFFDEVTTCDTLEAASNG
jgi:phi13 family phage major tail protein